MQQETMWPDGPMWEVLSLVLYWSIFGKRKEHHTNAKRKIKQAFIRRRQ